MYHRADLYVGLFSRCIQQKKLTKNTQKLWLFRWIYTGRLTVPHHAAESLIIGNPMFLQIFPCSEHPRYNHAPSYVLKYNGKGACPWSEEARFLFLAKKANIWHHSVIIRFQLQITLQNQQKTENKQEKTHLMPLFKRYRNTYTTDGRK